MSDYGKAWMRLVGFVVCVAVAYGLHAYYPVYLCVALWYGLDGLYRFWKEVIRRHDARVNALLEAYVAQAEARRQNLQR